MSVHLISFLVQRATEKVGNFDRITYLSFLLVTIV